jgi:hypothetical protein
MNAARLEKLLAAEPAAWTVSRFQSLIAAASPFGPDPTTMAS